MIPAAISKTPRVALLACRVFEQEIALHARGAEHIVETRFFDMGLHDHPDRMRALLQDHLSAVETRSDIDAVVLAYGLCGLGTAGLKPQRYRLVIPRAHDCITVFMGSKEKYAEHQRTCPGCYYYTPGWNRNRRVPGPDKLEASRKELEKKFPPDDVEFLLEAEREQWAQHEVATFLDLGTADAEHEADYAQYCAHWLNWKFERIRGDSRLLHDLLWCHWDDDRFQTIPPGQRLGHAPDVSILRAES